MKPSALLLFLVAVVISSQSAAAASPSGPPAETPAATEKLPEVVLPERKLEFVVSDEPVVLDPQGLPFSTTSQRWAAEFVIQYAPPRLSGRLHGRSSTADVAQDLLERSLTPQVSSRDSYFASRVSGGYSTSRNPLQYADDLLALAPKSRHPGKELIAMLKEAGRVRVLILPGPGRLTVPRSSDSSETRPRSFQVFASSSTEAEQLTRAMLQLLDYGTLYPIQQFLALQKDKYSAELREVRAKLEAAEKERADCETELASLDNIDEAALRELKNQQRLIAVEAAGAKARIDACNKILGDPKRRTGLDQQVETIKITAEIDLVSLTARKAHLDGIIKAGARAVELRAKADAAKGRSGSAKGGISAAEHVLAEVQTAQEQFVPFPIQDNRVTIRPVKWVEPPRSAPQPTKGF